MINLQQICWAVISAFVVIQELMRRAENLIYLHLPSDFLAVRLGVYRFTAYEQISLSPPLPKGRGRGIQIHAPHPGRSRLDAEQRADLFPRNKMDIGGLGIVVPIPVRYRRKDGGIYGHTQYGANNGVMLLGVQPPERIRCSYCRGSCGAISYRGGERAGLF